MPVFRTTVNAGNSREKIELAKEFRRNMTDGEKLLWNHLKSNRLCGYHFRRQQVIAGFIVDFYCHSAALIIEIDGPVHQSQLKEDEERDRAFQEKGYAILRIPDEQVKSNITEVLETILNRIKGEM